jgi:hypothetical protein
MDVGKIPPLDQCRTESQVEKILCERQENDDHRDQAKIFRCQKPGQDDPHPEM